ncbi:histidine-specific methyltransferase, SAM-dependent domain-containing protein [Sarocladium implicatum]|nr:histidine-specific methyltransferase, SAM-dependent domain-containing protein [Sarocladium implicatum]
MTNSTQGPAHGEILDIGGKGMYGDVGEQLAVVLKQAYDQKNKPTLPDELLYDDRGLFLWNEIIWSKEFYQTHDEIALFDAHADDIVSRIQPGVTMIDLGAGDTRKVEHLLESFERNRVKATYLALDISEASLLHNVAYVARRHATTDAFVRCAGLWGTFEDGERYVAGIKTPRLFLSLGSVLCNDDWAKAVHTLRKWAEQLRGQDFLLVGMDAHLVESSREKIWAAYHTSNDLFRQFFLNGFDHANRLAGETWLREEDWEFHATLEDRPTTRHRFYFKAKRDIYIKKFDRTIRAGEEFDWFDSHKYGEVDVRIMCSKAKLEVVEVWRAPGSEFRQYLLRRGRGSEHNDNDSAVSGV